MVDFYVRSDLACESCDENVGRIEGADWSVDERSGFRVSRLTIRSAEAARRLGKEEGCYITVECGRMNGLGEDDAREEMIKIGLIEKEEPEIHAFQLG